MKNDGQRKILYEWAYVLALVTIFYNLIEGAVSIFLGLSDETLSLFGFGLDSFVEVISGIGIWHMIRRVRQNNNCSPDRFEKQALRITGTSFYLLSAGLIITASINIYQNHKPITTFWGVIIAVISIAIMWILIHYKLNVGRQLNSQAILADANCTKACVYLSVTLLLSSVIYEITGIGRIDALGALIIALISLREGRESFGKAKGLMCSCE